MRQYKPWWGLWLVAVAGWSAGVFSAGATARAFGYLLDPAAGQALWRSLRDLDDLRALLPLLGLFVVPGFFALLARQIPVASSGLSMRRYQFLRDTCSRAVRGFSTVIVASLLLAVLRGLYTETGPEWLHHLGQHGQPWPWLPPVLIWFGVAFYLASLLYALAGLGARLAWAPFLRG